MLREWDSERRNTEQQSAFHTYSITDSFLLLERLKFFRSTESRNWKVSFVILNDKTCLTKLLQQVHCLCTILAVLLHHSNFFLENVELAQLCCDLLLFMNFCLLFILDLLLCSFSLALRLEQFGRWSLVC